MRLQLVRCENRSSRSWEAATDCGIEHLDVTTERSFMRHNEKNYQVGRHTGLQNAGSGS